MVFKSKQQQKPKALPHLPSKGGVAIPEVQVPSKHHEIAMPGQKPLPNSDWKEQQLVPSAQGNSRNNNKRLVVQKQGLPWTERGNFENHPEPPPMFSATPSRKQTLLHVREPNAQKQVYRMDGGLDPVTILTGRLDCWRLSIKSIVGLFKKISAVELKTSKGLIDASKQVIVPFEKGQGQFLELGTGGVQDVWASLRDYTTQHGILEHESAGYIDKAVVPNLRAIKTDIKTMIVSIQKDRDLKSDAIFESRLKIDKLIGRLDKTIELCNRSPQQAVNQLDPFLINLQIIHAIRELCDSENSLHDHLLNLQKEVGYFEQKIVENVRYVLHKFQDFRLKNKMEHQEYIGKVLETFDQIRPGQEWNEFIRRNQYNLILENSAYKTEDMVQYPNQYSHYVRAIKIGPLKAKTGVLKGYSQSVHILTPAGFLHGYKSPKYFQQHPLDPSYSIFVPDCDLDYYDDGSFQLRDNSRRMGMGVNSSFRPVNPRDGQEWVDELERLSSQHRVVPLFESSYYSAAPTTRHLPALPDNILPRQLEAPKAPAAIEQGEGSGAQHGESDIDPVLDGEHHPEEEEETTPVLDHQTLGHPAAAISKSASRHEEKKPLRRQSEETVTQPTLNQSAQQVPENGQLNSPINDSHKVADEATMNGGYGGLGATHAVQSVDSGLDKTGDSIIPSTHQLKNQETFNQNIYDQTHPSHQGDDSSVDWHSVNNEGFEHEKTIHEDDDNIEQVKKDLEQHHDLYAPVVNEAHNNNTTTTTTATF